MFIHALAYYDASIQPVLKSFLKNAKGATAIEYGLIAGGISLVIIAAVFAMGTDLRGMFLGISAKMSSAAAKVK